MYETLSVVQYLRSVNHVIIALAGIVFLVKSPQILKSYMLGRKKDMFECMGCGNCCRFKIIDLKEKDKKRLREGGYQNFEAEDGGRLKRVNGKCIFLNEDDDCTCYESRPEVCRRFPYQKTLGQWFAQKVYFCPGLQELKEK